MTKPKTVTVNLPFDGFYESWYSDAIDREEESFIDYRVHENGESEPDYESYWPETLKLDAEEYGRILFDVTSYNAAYEQIARDYVAAFDFVAGETFDISIKATRKCYTQGAFVKEQYLQPSIRATFESMDSPREYNFTTDRVYADIPISVMQALFRRSKEEKHATLAAVIAERFTSRDGFISGYSRHLSEWLSKPLRDWDHNELCTLLIAVMRAAGADPEGSEVRDRLFDGTCGDEGAYTAWSNAVDWEKFETKRAEMRAEKLAEWIESDCEAAMLWRANHTADFAALVAAEPSLFTGFEESFELPYRCPETVDMFTGKAG